jgi:hypothetical protein
MSETKSLLGSGWGMVACNKRYIFWFWLLNLMLAWLGVSAFHSQAQSILDHSLYADRLLHHFDVVAFFGMVLKPEFGPSDASKTPAVRFAIVFFLATVLFLPGVFQGYASNYRLPRDDFFRACGRNLWRFIRLLIVSTIVMGIVGGLLFWIQDTVVKKAGESTNELLPFELQMTALTIIFLVMTVLRIWFDLAEVDVVLSDQNAVRKSIRAGLRHTFRNLARLVWSYLVTTMVAVIVLGAGLWVWRRGVAPEGVGRAFVVSQLILLLLLIPRFWQRGVAVAYWQREMVAPVVVAPPELNPILVPAVVPPSVVPPPVPPVVPSAT